jgi:putative hemolysin
MQTTAMAAPTASRPRPRLQLAFPRPLFFLNHFEPRVRLRLERDQYVIRTAENYADLVQVFRLRHEVFYREMLHRWKWLGLDRDRFDFLCDHLMICKKTDGREQVVGTYRLNSSLYSRDFYAATEFNIDPVLARPGTKLELGRACVHRDFRSSVVLMLLWRGLSEYARQTGTQYMFGCSSIPMLSLPRLLQVHAHLMTRHLAPVELRTAPRPAWRLRILENSTAPADIDLAVIRENLPPLLALYLKTGAWVCGAPAFDKSFRCVDYLTVMDMAHLSTPAQKRYRS